MHWKPFLRLAPHRTWTALVLIAASLALFAGCTRDSRGPAPEENQALKDLERKIRPSPDPEPPPLDRTALLAESEAFIQEWVQRIDGDDEASARAVLITAEELEAVAAEGLLRILGPNLLPQNDRNLQSLLTATRGKEVSTGRWSPGKVELTGRGSLYRQEVPMMREASLEVRVAGTPRSLRLDLLKVRESWKVFRLEPVEG